MGMFLNSIAPYEGYREIARARFFVDKSSLIDELISAVKLDGQRYFCITRPRRFGKSVMANMIGAFFGRTADEKDIFDTLEIATDCQETAAAMSSIFPVFKTESMRIWQKHIRS